MVATIEYRQVEIHRIKPDPRNARTHSKKQIEQIAASIGENGFVNPILTNPEYGMIAGHGRLRAARKLRLTTVPVMIVAAFG